MTAFIGSRQVHRTVHLSPDTEMAQSAHLYVEYHVLVDSQQQEHHYILTVAEQFRTDGPDDGMLCPILEDVAACVVVYIPTVDHWKSIAVSEHVFQAHDVQVRTTDPYCCDMQIIEPPPEVPTANTIITEMGKRSQNGMHLISNQASQIIVVPSVWSLMKRDLQQLSGVDLRDIAAAHDALETTPRKATPIIPLRHSLLHPRQQ